MRLPSLMKTIKEYLMPHYLSYQNFPFLSQSVTTNDYPWLRCNQTWSTAECAPYLFDHTVNETQIPTQDSFDFKDHNTVVFNYMKSTRRVLGHSLLRSLVRSHRSLIRLLRTARFARALRCAHSFARSLTRSLRSSWERGFCL